MRYWHICLPCWGVEYIDKFMSGPVHCLVASLRHAGSRAELMVATDHPEYLQFRLSGIDASVFDLKLFPKPEYRGSKYDMFGEAHRTMLKSIPLGEYASLWGADMSVSIEFFAACEARLDQGFEMVAGFGPSTLPPYPEPGMTGRALMESGMARLHPRHANHIWPATTCTPSMFILRGTVGGYIAYSFHQHPYALKMTGKLARWEKGTCDAGLEDIVGAEKIHTVTDPDELGAVETSPRDTPFATRTELLIGDVVAFGRRRANQAQRKLFERRIVLSGGEQQFIDLGKIEKIIRGIQL